VTEARVAEPWVSFSGPGDSTRVRTGQWLIVSAIVLYRNLCTIANRRRSALSHAEALDARM